MVDKRDNDPSDVGLSLDNGLTLDNGLSGFGDGLTLDDGLLNPFLFFFIKSVEYVDFRDPGLFFVVGYVFYPGVWMSSKFSVIFRVPLVAL